MQKKTGFRQKITWQEATNQKLSQPQDRCDNIGSYTPIGLLFLYVRADVEQIVSEADDDSTITYWGTMLNTIGKYRGKP